MSRALLDKIMKILDPRVFLAARIIRSSSSILEQLARTTEVVGHVSTC